MKKKEIMMIIEEIRKEINELPKDPVESSVVVMNHIYTRVVDMVSLNRVLEILDNYKDVVEVKEIIWKN